MYKQVPHLELVDPQVFLASLVHGAFEVTNVLNLLNLSLNSIPDTFWQSISENCVEHFRILESIQGAALENDDFIENILVQPRENRGCLSENKGNLRLSRRRLNRLCSFVVIL